MNSSIFSLISIIIASCALGLTVYSLYATRRHNRLSVTPHLCGFTHKLTTDAGLQFTYELSNNGIGPAKITSFILLRDGKIVPKTKDELSDYVDSVIKAHLGQKVIFNITHSFDFGQDVSMRAGETRRIAEIFFPNVKNEQKNEVLKVFLNLDACVEYESFYGQKFTYDTRKHRLINI